MLHADVAAYAAFYVNLGLRGAVQFQLSAYTGTSHAQILQSTAEAGLFVSLEVVHTDYNIASAIAVPILGCRTIFSVQRDFAVVRSLQSVADDDLALGRNGVEPILHRALQVSTALARRPEYSVLQSVRKGLAPRLRSRVAIRAA